MEDPNSSFLEELVRSEEAIIMNYYTSRNSVHDMYKNRREESVYFIYIKKYLMHDEEKFMQYFRVTRKVFSRIFYAIRDDITRKPTNFVPKPISAMEKICFFLRYVATGETLVSLGIQFRISDCYASVIIKEVSKSIIARLSDEAFPPLTKELLEKSAEKFFKKWNFPNVVGAIDGKHIRLNAPPNSGSAFYNYKNFFSTVLFALVDADCKFMVVDIGACGREGDSGVFEKSKLGRSIAEGTFPWPEPKALPGTENVLSFFFLADEGLKLTARILRNFWRNKNCFDFSILCYNYRHSRARRVVECAFGILVHRFEIFLKSLNIGVDTVEDLVMSCCILHNFMIDENLDEDITETESYAPADNERLFYDFEAVNGGEQALEGDFIRRTLAAYFSHPVGSVDWQRRHVTRTE